jgi:hypothetical protein
VFANFTDLKSVPADSGFVKYDTCHSPLGSDVYFPHVNNHLNCTSVIEISQLEITLFFTTVFLHVIGEVCIETSSADVAVASLSAAARDVTEQGTSRGCNRKPIFPPPAS